MFLGSNENMRLCLHMLPMISDCSRFGRVFHVDGSDRLYILISNMVEYLIQCTKIGNFQDDEIQNVWGNSYLIASSAMANVY